MFTQKTPEMLALMKKLAPFKQDFGTGEVCPTCGKDITPFRNAISEREFKISGMCQKCQDSVFGKD